MHISTQCVHTGTIDCKIHPGVNSPIYTSTAVNYLEETGIVYPRYFNTPNQEAVVNKLCVLEKAEDGVLFSSGMAAITTAVLSLLKSGDHAIFQEDLYGGTFNFVTTAFEKFGLEYSLVDVNDPRALEAALRHNTKLLYIESPSNPLLKIIDIGAVAGFAKKHGLITAIDNTFASPINQNPFTMGIDMVIHSGTKYLGGHSDLCCGVVVASTELAALVRTGALQLGGALDAHACYLLERSLKTLELRISRQNENALLLARKLRESCCVEKVYYPGLEDHPGHEIAKKQMKGFGGMLSFELKCKEGECRQFLEELTLIRPAISLGGLETILCIPAETSHAGVPSNKREAMGIKDQLVRLSVGIEDPADLLADLESAMKP